MLSLSSDIASQRKTRSLYIPASCNTVILLYLTSDPLRTKRTPVRTTTQMAVNNKLTHGRRQESLNHNTPTSPPVCLAALVRPRPRYRAGYPEASVRRCMPPSKHWAANNRAINMSSDPQDRHCLRVTVVYAYALACPLRKYRIPRLSTCVTP
jgi:hypothetical protein